MATYSNGIAVTNSLDNALFWAAGSYAASPVLLTGPSIGFYMARVKALEAVSASASITAAALVLEQAAAGSWLNLGSVVTGSASSATVGAPVSFNTGTPSAGFDFGNFYPLINWDWAKYLGMKDFVPVFANTRLLFSGSHGGGTSNVIYDYYWVR